MPRPVHAPPLSCHSCRLAGEAQQELFAKTCPARDSRMVERWKPGPHNQQHCGWGWAASTCGTWDNRLLSTAWISQSDVSGMRRLWIFDGLPEINSKLTHMKVLLWYFYCLIFRSLLWPQSLNFPLTPALEQVKHPLTSARVWMQGFLYRPKEGYKRWSFCSGASYCSQLVQLHTSRNASSCRLIDLNMPALLNTLFRIFKRLICSDGD